MLESEFADMYHLQRVKFVSSTFEIEGMCTAACSDGSEWILAIMADGYEPGITPKKWITFRFPMDDTSFDNWIGQFEVVG